SARRILPNAEGAGEEAALVVDRLGLDQPGATELGLKKSHGGRWHGGKTRRCRKRAQAGSALERFDACSASAKGGFACGSRRGVQPRLNCGPRCAQIPAETAKPLSRRFAQQQVPQKRYPGSTELERSEAGRQAGAAGASTSRALSRSSRAASATTANGSFARSAMSSSECRPSARLRTQRKAMLFAGPSLSPPSAEYRPRRPSRDRKSTRL